MLTEIAVVKIILFSFSMGMLFAQGIRNVKSYVIICYEVTYQITSYLPRNWLLDHHFVFILKWDFFCLFFNHFDLWRLAILLDEHQTLRKASLTFDVILSTRTSVILLRNHVILLAQLRLFVEDDNDIVKDHFML